MAKKKAKAKSGKHTDTQKPSQPRRRSINAKEKVSKVIHQVKEPLSLLSTLKEEGLANALGLLTMASAVAGEARKNLKMEAIGPQLKEFVSNLGFASRADLDRLEARLEELEQKLSEREYETLRGGEEE